MVEASSEKIETNVEEVKVQPNGTVTMEEVKGEFSADRWVLYMQNIAKDPEAVDIPNFVLMLYETTYLFKKMGSAMYLAFSGKILCVFNQIIQMF